MTFANPLPWWAAALALAAIAAVSWLAYARTAVPRARRDALIALRFATLAMLGIFLMRPVRTSDDGLREVYVPILVDVSRSMGIDDADGARRIDRAREILDRSLLPVLGSRFHVELLAFGERLRETTLDHLAATDRRSNLSAALAAAEERYRGRAVPGLIVISDGGDTDDLLPSARGAPVYPLGVGSPTAGRDREVSSVTVGEAVADQSRIDLAVSAVSHGTGADPIALQLLENGKPIEVRRLVPAGDGVPVHTTFQVTPASGAATVYSIETPPGAGELVTENNRRSVLVEPPARQKHVLFVEGAPGFEHSFLKRAWSADPALDVDSIVRKGKNDTGADTYYIQATQSRTNALVGGYPSRAADLFAYDAIVLANVEPALLSREQQDLTRAFVADRGGGLLVLGARSFIKPGLTDTPLEDVIPLRLSERGDVVLPASSRGINRVALTPAGEAHPIMQLATRLDDTRKRWDATPALASTVPLGGPRPGASVLAVSGGAGGVPRALVAVQRYGEGRSMIFTGEGAWRWRMLLPSSDRSYDTFWRQAVRWLALASSDPVALRLPADGSPGDTITAHVLARDPAFVPQPDASIDVQITAPGGKTETMPASRPDDDRDGRAGYVASFRAEGPGVYRVSAQARRGSTVLGTAAASLLIGGSDQEMSDPGLDVKGLQRLALRTGGRLIGAGDAEAVAAELRAGVPAAQLSITRDLWHTGWSFAAIILLLCAEWMLRRRWGLR